MKHLASLLFLCLLNIGVNQAQELNFNFERWQEFYLYDEPKGYETYNFQSYFVTFAPNVTKIPGPIGSAIRLENKRALLDSAVVPGVLYIGDLAQFPAGGIPFNEIADSLTGYIRFNIKPGDTAIIVFAYKRLGITLGFDLIPIAGTLANFTKFTVPLTKPFFAPDSIVFLMTSGNTNNPIEGSFVEVDELKFTNTTKQVPNSSFENWESISFEEPEEWATANLLTTLLRTKNSVVKSTDASEGDYSLLLQPVYVNKLGLNRFFGATYFGETGSGVPTPIPYKSNKFNYTFSYKYLPEANDSALVIFRGFRFNPQTQTRETLFVKLDLLAGSPAFKTVSGNVGLLPAEMDSLMIEIYSGNYVNGLTPKLGSQLWIDNIKINEVTNTSINHKESGIKILTNPVSSTLTVQNIAIDNPVNQIEIYNQQFQKIKSSQISESQSSTVEINVQSLPSSNYFLMIKQKSGITVKTFTKI